MKRFSTIALSFLLACAVLGGWSSKASAQSALPFYNFYDFPLINGAPENLPANFLAIQLFADYATGSALTGPTATHPQSTHVPGIHQFDTVTLLYQVVYEYPWQPFQPHFQFGQDLFVSYAATHTDSQTSGFPGPGVGTGGGGFGDILWAPFTLIMECQTCPISDWFRPTQYISPLINFPSGDNDRNDAFPGRGANAYFLVLSFNGWHNLGPKFGKYLAGTLIQQDFVYVHQIDNNTNFPINGPGTPRTSFLLGDGFVFNNAVMFPVFKNVKIGPEVTWLDTFNKNQLNGVNVPLSDRAEELGVGPAVTFAVGPVNCFFDFNFDVYDRSVFRTFAIESTCDYGFVLGDVISELMNPTFL